MLLEKKLKPCENKNEFLSVYVVVLENDTAVLYDPKNYINRKQMCPELTKEVVKNMPGWVSAKINGNNKAAVAHYYIYPDAFFDNFKNDYNADNIIVIPLMKVELMHSEKKWWEEQYPQDFYVKGKGKVTVIVLFVLNEQGENGRN